MAEYTPIVTLTRIGPKTYSPGSYCRKECKGKTGISSNFKKKVKIRL